MSKIQFYTACLLHAYYETRINLLRFILLGSQQDIKLSQLGHMMSPIMNSKSHRPPPCEGCTYYQAQERNIGACHRFPPGFAGDSSPIDFHHWKFPLVSANNWCGEFQAATPGNGFTEA